MAAKTLDLRAPSIIVKFDKGKTFAPIFYYLAPDYSVINIASWTARMQARSTVNAATVLAGFDLTTENGGLAIVTGDCSPEDGITVTGAYGIQVNVAAATTAAIEWTGATFDIELIGPSGAVYPFIKGTLVPDSETTR